MDKRQNISTDVRTENLIEVLLAKLEHYEQRIDRLETRLFATYALPAPAQKVYTPKEAQQLLHITRNTLLTYRNAGKIHCSKTGNKVWFTQADIDAFLGTGKE
jgi:hypothetical protein